MSQISKQALIVDNNQSFPTNNAGDITPADLRGFNVNMIDSLVDEISYQSFTASVTNSINLLNAFTSSQQPTFNALNSFTASQLSINTGLNAATYSLNSGLNSVISEVDQLQTWSGSVNEIQSAGITKGYATRFNFSGLMTASITPNVNGAIADISLISDTTRVSTSSFNAYTASNDTAISNLNSTFNSYTQSQNVWNASATASITQLLSFSSSLDTTYATDAQLASATGSLINSINTKLSTASFNAYTSSQGTISSLNSYTASNDTKWNTIGLLTGSYAVTGSNSFSGSQRITGSVYGNVVALSVNANTASMDLSKGNFFTLQLVAGQNVRLEASNIQPGQTINLRLNQATASVGTISFPTYFDFPVANIASASAITGAVDIISFLTFDTNTIYSTIIKNLI